MQILIGKLILITPKITPTTSKPFLLLKLSQTNCWLLLNFSVQQSAFISNKKTATVDCYLASCKKTGVTSTLLLCMSFATFPSASSPTGYQPSTILFRLTGQQHLTVRYFHIPTVNMVYITITNGELTKRNKYSQHTGY